VGGGVRDLLLGEQPFDFDVATSALPEQVESLFPRTVSVGKAFGVVVVLEGGLEVEVATFRRDRDYSDGRHPTGVSFCDARQDAERRDLTINALFMEPETGEILDFVGGVEDLCARRVRTVGDPFQRFEEDHLRTLRAVRFAARLNFRIDPQTQDAIRAFVPRIRGISAERILAELQKMLTARGAGQALRTLFDLGLLEAVLPVCTPSLAMRVPGWYDEGPLIELASLSLERGRSTSAELGFATLLLFLGWTDPPDEDVVPEAMLRQSAEQAEIVMTGLSASKSLRRGVAEVLLILADLSAIADHPLAQQKRLVMRPGFDDALDLYRRISLVRGGQGLSRYVAYSNLARDVRRQPPDYYRVITGVDLVSMGYRPGPRFKRILEDIENRFLAGELSTREEALDYIRTQGATWND
jgi:poly(A) polymerase